MEFLATAPYTGLYLLSFLAATLLPLGSEWLLVTLLLKGLPAPTLIAVATLGNTLGACTTYVIGRWGSDCLERRVLRIDNLQRARAERFYRRFGCWSLLLSWLPVIGDPLCLVGGLLRVPFRYFLPLTAAGKFGRYLALALLVGGGQAAFG